MTFEDLCAVHDILGDKKFLLNDASPTTADCAVFGHLAQFLYIPMEFPQQKFMHEKCPNLVQYIDRMRDVIWPDWQEMCKKESMDGNMGYDWEESIN